MGSKKDKKISGNIRFLKSLIPALILMITVFTIITFIATRVDNGIGTVLGIIAGGCFGFGVLLVYWNAVDWVNLGIIRKQPVQKTTDFQDGQLVAFSGTVRVEGAPMVSPFTQQECAAYTYTIAVSRQTRANRGGSRKVLAQGFHMLPTSIEGSAGVLRLGALPSVEDDLRVNEKGKWTDVVRKKLGGLIGSAPRGNDMEREGALLEARHKVDSEMHKDFCQLTELGEGKIFVVDEEILPANQMVCVVGTFDQELNAITASKPRFGPDLMVYCGNADEVLARVGGEIGWYTKFAVGMLVFTAAAMGYAMMAGV